MEIVLNEKEKEFCRKVCEQIKKNIDNIENKYLSNDDDIIKQFDIITNQPFNGM